MTRPAPSKLVDDLVRIRQWSQRAQGQGIPEVDTVNVIVGDGTNVIVAGVAAAIRADFRARITGIFLQEFDGTSGSVALSIERAQGGASPSWVQISPTTPPGIASGRYYAGEDMSDWADTLIERGDYLRFVAVSATSIMRVHVALRMRRLEP